MFHSKADATSAWPLFVVCGSVQLAMAGASPGGLLSRFVHSNSIDNTLPIFATYAHILLSSISSGLLRVRI